MIHWWHTAFDEMYKRKPQTLGGAVETLIEDATWDTRGELEDLKVKQREIVRVLKVVCDNLDPVRECRVAEALGFKPAPTGGGQ
jgi:hypothetical protein